MTSMSPPAKKPKKEKAERMSQEETLYLAHLYVDKRDLIKGKFEGASKGGRDKKKELFQAAATALTAMGVAKRSVDQIKEKFTSMEKKVRKVVGQMKAEGEKTGGGKPADIFMSPATKIMLSAFHTSDSVHGIKGGVDSDDRGTIISAKKNLFGREDDSLDREDDSLDGSVDETETSPPNDQSPSKTLRKYKSPSKKSPQRKDESPNKKSPSETLPKSTPKKRSAAFTAMQNAVKKKSKPTVEAKRELLIDLEVDNARLRKSLLEHKIYYKQLQIAQLEKNMDIVSTGYASEENFNAIT